MFAKLQNSVRGYFAEMQILEGSQEEFVSGEFSGT